jgi:hypothetical protein
MKPRLFLPTARQVNVLLIAGFLALGYAMYLRYLVIEQSSVGVACEEGLDTWTCRTRFVANALQRNSVFGVVALGAAILNLIRPSLVLFALGIAATAAGLVLYNAGLSGLAAALLIVSLARPARAEE